ncbi:MAG TPA: sulfurtransferase TusA family protein [Chloroflexota bacterium]
MKLDVRGEICPYPMMRAVEALKKLPEGEVLEVYTDHAPALSTIPWEAAKLGFEAEIEETGSPEWRITLRRGDGTRSSAEVLERIATRLQELNVE